MAAVSLYLLTSAENDATYGWAQMSGTAPGSYSDRSTTFSPNKTGTSNYSEFAVGGTNLSFSTTVQPSGSGPDGTNIDCIRSASAYTGTFASGTWTLNTHIHASSAQTGGGFVRARWRLWKAAADGSSPTQIGTGTALGSAVAMGDGTTTVQVSTGTISPGSTVAMSGEYLFIEWALEITTASSKNYAITVSTAQTGSATLTTPDFTTGGSTYTHGEAESSLASDALASFQAFAGSQAEAALAADAYASELVSGASYPAGQEEAALASDASSAATALGRNGAEAANAAEALSARQGFASTEAEAALAADSYAATVQSPGGGSQYDHGQSEAALAADAYGASVAFGAAQAEGALASDAAGTRQGFTAGQAETAAPADVQGRSGDAAPAAATRRAVPAWWLRARHGGKLWPW